MAISAKAVNKKSGHGVHPLHERQLAIQTASRIAPPTNRDQGGSVFPDAGFPAIAALAGFARGSSAVTTLSRGGLGIDCRMPQGQGIACESTGRTRPSPKWSR